MILENNQKAFQELQYHRIIGKIIASSLQLTMYISWAHASIGFN